MCFVLFIFLSHIFYLHPIQQTHPVLIYRFFGHILGSYLLIYVTTRRGYGRGYEDADSPPGGASC